MTNRPAPTAADTAVSTLSRDIQSPTWMRSSLQENNLLPADIVTMLNLAQHADASSPTLAFQPALERVSARLQARIQQQQHAVTTIRAGEGSWETLLPGVAMKVLQRHANTQSYLLRLAPGAVVPAHRHTHTEECIVLQGEVRMANLHVKEGGYHRAPASVAHDAVTSPTGALLYLRGGIPSRKDLRWQASGMLGLLLSLFRQWRGGALHKA
ncbi:cupin domain-containing protein [Parvibium lacunae]|uniref:ChrR-like cupin domain-containing protein n=1 Tax=Parvibium lacunae TaxID=1888893 RepID=A0A368KZW8_9BURK|nr:cupin domain-containing protein [Parvibium lacunae]RCS56840.1 hypothetical protein DU000_10895 [Parvibium lacunae]